MRSLSELFTELSIEDCLPASGTLVQVPKSQRAPPLIESPRAVPPTFSLSLMAIVTV